MRASVFEPEIRRLKDRLGQKIVEHTQDGAPTEELLDCLEDLIEEIVRQRLQESGL